jgi:hypothetical protein
MEGKSRFLDHHHHVDLLCSILYNFKQAGNVPDIRLVTADIEHRKIWAFSHSQQTSALHAVTNDEVMAYKPLGHDRLTRAWHGVSPIITANLFRGSDDLFEATVSTEFPAKNLDLGDDMSPFDPTSFSIPSRPQTAYLRSLRLTPDLEMINQQPSPEKVELFVRFLYAARNLEHFFLRASRDLRPGKSDVVFHHAVTNTGADGTALADLEGESLLPKLRSFEFLSPMSRYFSTLRFLTEHRDTVTDVKLGFFDDDEFPEEDELSARRKVQEVLGSSPICKAIVIRVCGLQHEDTFDI